MEARQDKTFYSSGFRRTNRYNESNDGFEDQRTRNNSGYQQRGSRGVYISKVVQKLERKVVFSNKEILQV